METSDPMANLRNALQLLESMRQTVLVHPDLEADVAAILDVAPMGHLFTVVASGHAPPDTVYLFKHTVWPDIPVPPDAPTWLR